MTQYDAFHRMADLINKERISCVLIGGFAVNFHKYTRLTTDIDFLMTKADFLKIEDALGKIGYENHHIHDNFAQFKDSNGLLMNIDFMFVDQKTVNEIKKEGKTIQFVGEEFTIPSLHHLIALKLHSIKCNKGRFASDILDIIKLIQINKLDIKNKEFESLCLKFGSEDIYKKILELDK